MASDFGLTVEAQGLPITGLVAPQFAVDTDLRIDIEVANRSTKSYGRSAVRIDFEGGSTVQASPVLRQYTPPAKSLATFEIGALRFLAHPTEPYMFATIPKTNSLAIFNINTLQLEANFFVGSRPYGMALSNDGNTLYVANSTSQFLAVVDWKARTVTKNLNMPEPLLDVEVGSDGRLYVLSTMSLTQRSPDDGRSIGPGLPVSVYSGELAISPRKDRLYYGNFALSVARLYQFDLSTTTPTLLWHSNQGNTSGANGNALAISTDGTFISYAAGFGSLGYRIPKFRTSDMAIEGTFDTGAFTNEITFSPDGKTAFAVHKISEIDVFDTTTFIEKPPIQTGYSEASNINVDLMVDSTGRRLFATQGSSIDVFSTDREIRLVNMGDTNHNDSLDPGETWMYSVSTQVLPALQKVKIVGTFHSQGNAATVEAAGQFIGVASPVLTIQSPKQSTTQMEFLAGTLIPYTFLVTNPNSVHFANVRLLVEQGARNEPVDKLVATLLSGDSNKDGILNPGEAWLFSTTVLARPGTTNVSVFLEADMTDRFGEKLPGQVPAKQTVAHSYFGISPGVSLRMKVDGLDVTATDLLFAEAGSTLDASLFATNSGNVPLSGVLVGNSSTTDDGIVFEDVLGFPTRRGDLMASFAELGGRVKFLADPLRNVIYIAMFDRNLVAVLDINRLQIIDQFAVGAGPNQLALSTDNQILYIACSSGKQISRVDLHTRSLLSPFPINRWVMDVKVGADRLYVLTDEELTAIDRGTGQKMGQSVPMFRPGEMMISPDLQKLYLGLFATNPASLMKFQLSGNNISLEATRSDASNGQDLALSNDGRFVAMATSDGQFGYNIVQYRTDDMTIVGSFNTGPYPREIVYSPDGKTAFIINDEASIRAWDTETFEQLYSISTISETDELQVSPDGQVLLAASRDILRVYDLNRGFRYNVGDIDRDRQLDVGESWQYLGKGTFNRGKHIHSTTIVSSYKIVSSYEHIDTLSWGYEGIVDGTFALANVTGAPIIKVEQQPVYISDSRLEYREGMLFLKSDEFFQRSKNPVEVQLVFIDQSSITIPIHVRRNDFAWHNGYVPYDVDQDSIVSPLDVLLLVNELNVGGARRLGTRHVSQTTWFDVNADGNISPLDVLMIVNEINRSRSGTGESEGDPTDMHSKVMDHDQLDVKRHRGKSAFAASTGV